jgi:hypothetical protein
MNFFDWKKFTLGQWLALGTAVAFLVLFFWSEHERRRPFDEAAQGLEEVIKKDKQLDCKFLGEQQNWAEYDKKKCNTL